MFTYDDIEMLRVVFLLSLSLLLSTIYYLGIYLGRYIHLFLQ